MKLILLTQKWRSEVLLCHSRHEDKKVSKKWKLSSSASTSWLRDVWQESNCYFPTKFWMNGAIQMQGTQSKRTVSACPLMEYNQKTFLSWKTKSFSTYLLTVWLSGCFYSPRQDRVCMHLLLLLIAPNSVVKNPSAASFLTSSSWLYNKITTKFSLAMIHGLLRLPVKFLFYRFDICYWRVCCCVSILLLLPVLSEFLFGEIESLNMAEISSAN